MNEAKTALTAALAQAEKTAAQWVAHVKVTPRQARAYEDLAGEAEAALETVANLKAALAYL